MHTAMAVWKKRSLALGVSLAVSAMAAADEGGLVGGELVRGSADIAYGGLNTTITQSSNKAVINWQAFSVAEDASVSFVQPGKDAVILNRVTGDSASSILGSIKAPGNVFLVNRNGIVFGENSRVDVGGLVASTFDIADDDFWSGNYLFNKPGMPGASVENAGQITVREGGLAAFVAPWVANSGIITARLGKVALGASETGFALDFYGDNLVKFVVQEQTLERLGLGEDSPLGVNVSGLVQADGGTVAISADVAREVVSDILTIGGEVRANSVASVGGRIILSGGDSGTLRVAEGAVLDASGERGGSIDISGDTVLMDGVANASGDGSDYAQAFSYLYRSGAQQALIDSLLADTGGGDITVDADWLSLGGTLDASGAKGGNIRVNTGNFSNAGTTLAQGGFGDGGVIRLNAERDVLEFSMAEVSASGLINGGDISLIGNRQITTSATYTADGLHGQGGNIDITAPVAKSLSAQYLARGGTAGGRIRFGGEFQGGRNLSADELPSAEAAVVSDGSLFDVSGGGNTGEQGGELVIWSNEQTIFQGDIEGDGANVEISSAGYLELLGSVNIGEGQLFLDPKNITIEAAPTATPTLNLIMGIGYNSGNDVSLSLEDLERFGNGVSLDGQHLAIGTQLDDGSGNTVSGAGAVYLYSFTGNDFTKPVLSAMIGADYTGGNNFDETLLEANDNLGISVSLDGTHLAVGATSDDGSGNPADGVGAVYLYSFSGDFTGITRQAIVGKGYTGGNNFDESALGTKAEFFGTGVALDGNHLAVGSLLDDGSGDAYADTGAVYLYKFTGDFTGISREAIIGKGYTGGNNFDLSQLDTGDSFGTSVTLQGSRLAVGAPGDDGSAGAVDGAGAVYLFSFSGDFTGITHQATIGNAYSGTNDFNETTLTSSDRFGVGVSLDSGHLAVGASSLPNGAGSSTSYGGVILYEYTGDFTNITRHGILGKSYTGGNNFDVTNVDFSDAFGNSVSLDGSRLAVGATSDRGQANVGPRGGAVYLFNVFPTVPSGATGWTYSDNTGASSTVYVKQITDLLNVGTNVTLQASNDLTLNTNLTSTGSGNLNFQTGRSILLNNNISLSNGNLSLRANDTSANGVVNADRDSGAAAITMATGTSISTGSGTFQATLSTGAGNTNTGSGDINLRAVSSGSILVENLGPSNGNIVLNGTLTASGTLANSTSIVVAAKGGNLVNNTGAGALVPGTGQRYLVYSQNPSANTLGGLTGTPWYNTLYNPSSSTAISGTGNRLVYNQTAQLTATANNTSRAYGAANPTFSANITGFVNSETSSIVSGSASLSSAATATTNVGTATITAALGTLATDRNYSFSVANGTLTINPATLTVTANNASRLYAAANPSFSGNVTGFVNGQDASVISGLSYGTAATTASNVGTYAITGSGASASNYSFNYVNGTLTVNPVTLTVTANNASRLYGAANPSFSGNVTGFVNGQDASVISGLSYGTAATTTSNVGSYAISGSGASATNYSFNYVNGTLTVNPATLTVTANNASRAYGAANPSFTASYSGFLNGDTSAVLSGSPALTTTAAATTNVGTVPISAAAGNLSASNYVFSFANGTLTINPATLTVTANNASRLYGAANPSFSGNVTGFVNGQDASVISGLSYGTAATTASNVGTYAITGSGASASNYTFNYVNGTLTVNPVTLTVTANNASRLYGATNPSFSGNVTGFVNGQDASVISGLSYGSAATTASNVGSYAISGSGASATNYSFNYVNGTLTVNPATLTVTANNASRTYGAANPGFTASYSGFLNGDTNAVLSGSPTLTTTATATTNVGTAPISAAAGSLSASNYVFSFANGTLTINPATLTVTANNASRLYGAANPGFTASYSGFLNGDTSAVLSGSPTLTTTATTSSNVGTAAISSAAGSLSASNYVFSFANGTLTINPATLTVTANNASRLYGAANPSFTGNVTGFVNGQDASVISGLSYGSAATTASNVGTYAITGSGASASNYSFNYVNGTLTVNPATLTVTANNASRTYGAANPGFTASYSGFLNGDTSAVLSGSPTLTTTATTSSNVGTAAISSAAGSLSASNYVFSFANGTLTINPATLTVTANNASRLYGAANPSFTGNVTGFVNGQDASVISGLSYGTAATTASNVGTYAITGSGASASNYSFNYVNGTLTVNPATLTVTANNASRTYGAANPGFTASYSGFLNGDTSAVLSGTPSLATTATASTNVGTAAISSAAGSLSASNYVFSFANGTLTINPATLTVTANNASRLYGAANPSFTGNVTGFVNGQDASVISGLSYGSAATKTSNVGSYAISGSGASASNYTFNYVNGTLTVNPATLTVKANDAVRAYGAENPTFTASYTGFLNGDTSAVLSGSPALTTTATTTTDVGKASITSAAGSLSASNYVFSFAPGTLSIVEALLTITIHDASRLYGASNPGFSSSISGLINGDTEGVVSGLQYSTNATAASGVGGYTITGSGATANRYTINYVNGTLNITPAPLVVVANDYSRSYGAENPAFDASFRGFVNGDGPDVVSGLSFTTDATQSSSIGDYIITPSGGSAANYTLSVENGSLHIDPALLTVTAKDASRLYGAANPAFEASVDGFVNGDGMGVLSGLSFSTAATPASNVGGYSISPSGATAGNYVLAYVDGELAIVPAALVVTANDDSKKADGIAYAGGNGVRYGGFVNGDNDADLSGELVYGGNAQGAVATGSFVIMPGGLISNNYDISFAPGTLTIEPAGGAEDPSSPSNDLRVESLLPQQPPATTAMQNQLGSLNTGLGGQPSGNATLGNPGGAVLVVANPLTETLLVTNSIFVELPAGMFDHEDDTATYEVTATLANGEPLPEWLSYDAQTNTLSGTAPEGFNGTLEVLLTAEDAQQNTAQTTVTIRVESETR